MARWVSGRTMGWVGLAVLTGALVTGCGDGGAKQRIQITVYPKWDKFKQIERIAVVPFSNQTKNPQAGQIISDKLYALLAQNGTYKDVLNRADLAKIMGEQNLSKLTDFSESTQIPEGVLKAAQVLVLGSVSEFQVVTKTETRTGFRPQYFRDAYGNTVIRQVPYQYPFTSIYATVAATVRVVDAATGSTLWASDLISSGSVGEEGRDVEITPAQARDDAANIVVRKMLAEIAAVNIELKPKGQVIYTASGYFDGEYNKSSKFTPEDGKVLVVISLGRDATNARDNVFKVAVAPANQQRNVAEADLVWSGDQEAQAVEFQIDKITAEAGMGEYVAKVYAGPKPFAEFRFTISAKKK